MQSWIFSIITLVFSVTSYVRNYSNNLLIQNQSLLSILKMFVPLNMFLSGYFIWFYLILYYSLLDRNALIIYFFVAFITSIIKKSIVIENIDIQTIIKKVNQSI